MMDHAINDNKQVFFSFAMAVQNIHANSMNLSIICAFLAYQFFSDEEDLGNSLSIFCCITFLKNKW
ncbi:hypothetical protein CLU79DRAFT_724872 [Phycomyces nitens]|nr:hypothetical protein CLU79DRAFT_724872 [Phycomyces nitens]